MNEAQLMYGDAELLNRRAFRVSVVTAVFMAVLWVVSFIFTPVSGFNPLREFGFGALTAASLLSAGLAHYGRSHYGIWLIVFAAYSVSLWTTWISIVGLGPVLGILSLLIASSISAYALPRKFTNWTMIVVIVGTIIVILGDFASPVARPLSPDTQVINIITMITLLIYGIFISTQFRYYTLRTKLGILFIGIGILSVASVGIIVSRLVRDAITVQVTESMTQQTEKLSDFLGSVFIQKAGQVRALAAIDSIKTDLAQRNETLYTGDESQIIAEIQQLDAQWLQAADDDPLIVSVMARQKEVNPTAFQLYDFLEAFPEQTEIFITDKYGATVGATNRLTDYYQADEAWWQAAWNEGEGAVYLSDPEYDESAQVTAIQIALPIVSEETEEILGIVRTTLVLNDLFEVVADTQIGETGHAILIDRDGNILFEGAEVDDHGGAENLPLTLRQQLAGITTPHFMLAPNEHEGSSIFAHAPVHIEGFAGYEERDEEEEVSEFETAVSEAVEALGWVIVLRQEENDAFAAVSRIANALSLVGVIVVGLIMVIAAIFANTLTRPIRALSKAAAAIAEGDLGIPLPSAGQDEIGELTAEFANMASQLQQTVGELQQRTLIIETSAEVSRQLSTILNERELLSAVVNQVQQGFGYYHAHIYLLNEHNDRLIMAAGTGQAAQEMLAQKHGILMGDGLVGRAAAAQEVVLASDVRQDPNWLPNTLLPETKAEIAVPIVLGGQVLGILDVQHNIVNGLQEQDADLLQLLANQIAIALQNARLFTRTQRQATQQVLVNEIGRKIQTAQTIERVLQVAAEELGQALNMQRTTVQLNSREHKNGR